MTEREGGRRERGKGVCVSDRERGRKEREREGYVFESSCISSQPVALCSLLMLYAEIDQRCIQLATLFRLWAKVILLCAHYMYICTCTYMYMYMYFKTYSTMFS